MEAQEMAESSFLTALPILQKLLNQNSTNIDRRMQTISNCKRKQNVHVILLMSVSHFVKELSERSNLPEHLSRPIVKLACSLSYNKGP